MEFFLFKKHKIAVETTLNQNSAISKALLEKFSNQNVDLES